MTLRDQFCQLSTSEHFLLFFSFQHHLDPSKDLFQPDSTSILTSLLFHSRIYSPSAARMQIWCVMPLLSHQCFLFAPRLNAKLLNPTPNTARSSRCLLPSPSVGLLFHLHTPARWASFQFLVSFLGHLLHSCYSSA